MEKYSGIPPLLLLIINIDVIFVNILQKIYEGRSTWGFPLMQISLVQISFLQLY